LGSPGFVGVQGATGFPGPAGEQGTAGPAGATGFTGQVGSVVYFEDFFVFITCSSAASGYCFGGMCASVCLSLTAQNPNNYCSEIDVTL